MSGGNKGPAHQAGMHFGKDHAGRFVDINPLNMEAYPNQKPAPDQPFDLSTERQVNIFQLIPHSSYHILNLVITSHFKGL